MGKYTEEDLRRWAGDSTYMDGDVTEEDGGVYNFTVRRVTEANGDNELQADAFFDGESVYAAFSDREESVLNYIGCSCSAFRTLRRPCFHCSALVLHFLRNEKEIRSCMQDSEFYREAEQEPKPKTEKEFAAILRKMGKRERQKLTGEISAAGSVHLEPTLHVTGGEAYLTLRVGMERMYVVKDIRSFLACVKENREHSYGKNLAFVHSMEVFDEKSAELINFLKCRISTEGYWYYRQEKEFVLEGADFDAFLEITGKDGVLLETKKNRTALWTMSDGPFTQRITITGTEDGAYLSCRLPHCIRTENYRYYMKDKVLYRVDRRERQDIDEFDEYLRRNHNEKTFISKDDLPLFVREMLPLAEQYYQIRMKDFSPEQYLPDDAEFRLYLDLPQDNMITCDLVAVYSEEVKYHVFEGVPQKGIRNVRQELEMSALVRGYCNAFDSDQHLAVAAEDDDCLYALLTEGIPKFRDRAEVYISDSLKKLTDVRRPRLSLGVSLSGGLLNLKMQSEGLPLDELAAILSKYDRKKKFFRMKDGAFLSMEDEDLATLAQVKKGLMLTDKQFAKGELTLPKFRALYLDAQLKENRGIAVKKSRDFKAMIRDMRTVEDSDYEVPGELADTLRSYQKIGYQWMETLYANGFGGILADDMGLGKTLQVITFLAAHYGENENSAQLALIVCPASLVYNWEEEFRKFAPWLPVITVAGGPGERKVQLGTLPERAVIITSYSLLQRDLEMYQKLEFDIQVIDEAQFIKNANTKAARAVKIIPSRFRMALTGTPVENRLSELWSIFDYLMPGYLYTYAKFRREIEIPVVQNGDDDAMQRLQKMIAPFILRRMKKDVLKDLPDKIERNMTVQLGGEQRKLYEAHVQRLQLFLGKQSTEEFDKSKIQILAELTKLRQLCCDPALLYENYGELPAKTEMCMELVGNAAASGHKILIFSQFTSMLDRIAEELHRKQMAFYMLTGATPKKERIRMVNAFNQDEVPVFCISLKAGGTGLNLTAADIVIHYDPWWNTAAETQATDRTHRIGQKNTVVVYRLIARDTIEENIVRLQEKKRELAEQVLGAGELSTASFSKEELMELLTDTE